jgi:hypothetical protein
MRWKLWRRRLTISAPRMAIRSAIPWPVRWLLGAVVLGLSAALALWTFEKGRDFAGLDRESVQIRARLQEELDTLNRNLERAQAVANTAETLLTAERRAQEVLATQLQELQEDNRRLRRELGFYEQLIPTSGEGGLSVRALSARRVESGGLRWQVLLVQSTRNAPEFKGQLKITYTGERQGQPWELTEPAAKHPVAMRQSLRLEGRAAVPAGVVVKLVTVRLMQGDNVLLTQATKVAS